jgi:hypothetical protein
MGQRCLHDSYLLVRNFGLLGRGFIGNGMVVSLVHRRGETTLYITASPQVREYDGFS